MKLLFSFILLAVHLSTSFAFGLESPKPLIALECKSDQSTVTFFVDRKYRVILHEELTLTNFVTNQSRVEKRDFPLALIGKTNLEYAWGTLEDRDPVAGFVSKQDPGNVYATLAITRDPGRKSHAAEYVYQRSSTSLSCEEGPGYASLQKKIEAAPTISKSKLMEYWDESLALKCNTLEKSTSVPGSGYQVRAFSSGYGDSSIMVEKTDVPPEGALINLNPEGETSSAYRFVASFRNTSYSFTLLKQPLRIAGRPAVYSAEYFDGQSKVVLSCEERWGLNSNIIKPIAERNAAPKAFPTPLGTLADLDPKYCGDAQEAVSILVGKYRDLLGGVPDVVGFGATKAKANSSAPECFAISVYIKKDGGDMDRAKSIIGLSLEGAFVKYEYMAPMQAL